MEEYEFIIIQKTKTSKCMFPFLGENSKITIRRIKCELCLMTFNPLQSLQEWRDQTTSDYPTLAPCWNSTTRSKT